MEAKLKSRFKILVESAFAAGALLLAAAAWAANAPAQAGGPDPVQKQAWDNAGTVGSSMTCDYMPASCDGWRSGGSTGVHAGGSTLVSSESSYMFPAEKELRPGCEARWEKLYAGVLLAEMTAGRINAPTYEAYAKAYGKPRNPNRAACSS